MDWRITRAEARRRVVASDATRRERMPFFRNQPPLTPDDIDASTPYASARHAFWRDERTPRPLEEAIAGGTKGQVILYCVPYSHSDICNGGFHQYFSNPTGDLAALTIEALRTLGEHARAELMVRAMGRFPSGVASGTQAARQAVLSKIDFRNDWQVWARPIEDAYYALDGEQLERRIDEYVASHPREFFLDD